MQQQRDGCSAKIYDRERSYRYREREVDPLKNHREHGWSTDGPGTITLYIRTGDTQLPYVLPIAKVRTYDVSFHP